MEWLAHLNPVDCKGEVLQHERKEKQSDKKIYSYYFLYLLFLGRTQLFKLVSPQLLLPKESGRYQSDFVRVCLSMPAQLPDPVLSRCA